SSWRRRWRASAPTPRPGASAATSACPAGTPAGTIEAVGMRWRPALLQLLLLCAATGAAAQPVVVGSKRFTESYILGELARQALQASGRAASHRQGLGNTAVMEQALATGGI